MEEVEEDHKRVTLRKCESQDHKLRELGVLGHKLNSPGSSQGFLHHCMNIIYFVHCLKLDSVRSKQWPESKRIAVCVVEVILSHFCLALLLEKLQKVLSGKTGISNIKWPLLLIFQASNMFLF